MLYEDPIVKEVREIRRLHSEKYGHDLGRICEAIKEREKCSDHILIKPQVKSRTDTASR